MRLLRHSRVATAKSPSRPGSGLLVALLVVAACVVARSLVFVAYEQSFFDSDQAIVGLMAKHISEGRAFPLFDYGQIYLLSLEAWFTAPFFLVFGPTVTVLHVSTVVLNLVAAGLSFAALVRWGAVRPFEAAAALSFFTFAPPLTAASLTEPVASIGVFIAVPLFWMLRARPVWLGVAAAVGVLYRSFSIYGLVALVAMDLWQGTLWRPARARVWLVALAVGAVTWLGVQQLKPYADMAGPGTRGASIRGYESTQIDTVMGRLDVDPAAYPARTIAMFGTHLPNLYGARSVEQAIATQGHDWLFWVLALGLPVLLAGAVVNGRRTGFEASAFGWFLIGVGTLSAIGFIATRPADDPTERYYLLALFLPIGITAVSFALNRTRAWRALTMTIVALVMAGSIADHLRQARRYWGSKVPDDIRILADGLVARGITVAIAGYWRAYKITFVAQEKVKVATTDVVRIEEYQRLAEQAGSDLIHIREEPCPGGDQLGIWYLCPD